MDRGTCMSLMAVVAVVLFAAVGVQSRPITTADPTLRVWNPLGDHMVLQRAPASARIWGSALPGDVLTISFNHQTLHALSGPNTGLWEVMLPPTSAGGPYEIVITSGKSGESVTLSDILFGDVYLCGGQSNMQMTTSLVFNATEVIAEADEFPNIRIFTVGQTNVSDTPQAELIKIAQKWSVASKSSVGGPDWQYFSAVCWFFGRDLYLKLGEEVPIGLVSSNWGGTIIEAWSSPEALAVCNTSRTQGTAPAPKSTFGNLRDDPNRPSVLWNAMIVPFLPMTLTGAVWYQGEANVGRAEQYECQFPAMIQDWRSKFGNENLYFGFVQLAPYEAYGNELVAQLRVAQLFGLSLSNTGMASAVDLGDLNSTSGNIHPRNKAPVGYRLALGAMKSVYHMDVQALGPIALTARVTSSGQITIGFAPQSIGSLGLYSTTAECPEGLDPKYCAGFVIKFKDGSTQVPKNVLTTKTSVVLTFVEPFGTSVALVSYGMADWPLATLYNGNNLPASPFEIPIQ